MDSIKINSLEMENVKKIKVVQLAPTENGLTVIGGRNAQGKTSVLDGIAWALGGDRFKPDQAKREGAIAPPYLRIQLSNGLIVERKGDNSSLKVTDPNGNKGGQQLLNEFVEQLALNLPKFLNASDREKAETLLKIIGVEDELKALEHDIETTYNTRHSVGLVKDQKKKFAAEMPMYAGVPDEPVSAMELIKKQQEILAKNGENQRKRAEFAELQKEISAAKEYMDKLTSELEKVQADYARMLEDEKICQKTVSELQDESTKELEESLLSIEAINTKVRANLERQKAELDAESYTAKYDELTKEIEDLRTKKQSLLNGADLPLPELSVDNGKLTYKGFNWENLSSSEQLKVATAIIRKLNPKCGFVLLDKLEQLDTVTLNEFGEWLKSEGLQAIATRVSTGSECQIIIEDGYSSLNNSTWKKGEF